MGYKSISFEDYLKIVPQEYRDKVVLLEDFIGNRTKISYTFICGCNVQQLLKSFLLKYQQISAANIQSMENYHVLPFHHNPILY